MKFTEIQYEACNETASAVSWDRKSHSESKYKEVVSCFIAIWLHVGRSSVMWCEVRLHRIYDYVTSCSCKLPQLYIWFVNLFRCANPLTLKPSFFVCFGNIPFAMRPRFNRLFAWHNDRSFCNYLLCLGFWFYLSGCIFTPVGFIKLYYAWSDKRFMNSAVKNLIRNFSAASPQLGIYYGYGWKARLVD